MFSPSLFKEILFSLYSVVEILDSFCLKISISWLPKNPKWKWKILHTINKFQINKIILKWIFSTMRQSWKTLKKKKKIQRKVRGLIWQTGNRKFYCIRATIGNIIINVIFTGKTPSINIYVYIYVVYTCRHCWSLVNSPFFFPPSFVKRLSERDAKYAFSRFALRSMLRTNLPL